MIRAAAMPPDPLRAAIETRASAASLPEGAAVAADTIARAGGETVRGLIFFGSRRTAAAPDPWSAYDFFVATRGYAGFYESMRASGHARRGPRLLAALNAWLPPSQLHLRWRAPGGDQGLAKCAVIDLDRLARETDKGRQDHFCIGRLFQPATLAYSADADSREALLDVLTRAHRLTYWWVRPWLPDRFDVEGYCRTLLEVSMRHEIRPEPRARVVGLWAAQRDEQMAVYPVLLRELVGKGELTEDAGRFAVRRAVTATERLRTRAYFARSLARATLRWPKYVVSVSGWLDYLLRKVERRTGHRIQPTAAERKLPLLLLWGKFYRFWRARDRPPDD
jgi:hypothetical protein